MDVKPVFVDYPDGVTTIDANYVRPGLASSHLIVEGEHAAFVETGTSHSVPLLLATLEKKGIPRENVSHVMVTHVHLDHAGGAGELLRFLPGAKLVVHPRGARHMTDPSKLIAGSAAVYGKDQMRVLFGTVVPVPEERILIADDGLRIDFHGRPLYFFDGPGHARHHYCVIDEKYGNFYSGDNFGISYREFDNDQGPFIFPTTTPVQFDPPAMFETWKRVMEQLPEAAYLTHFGRVGNLEKLAADLRDRLSRYVELAEKVRNSGTDREGQLEQGIREILHQDLKKHGCSLSTERIDELLANDCVFNAHGIAVWLDRSASA